MIKVYDYQCPMGHITEVFVHAEDKDATQTCKICKQRAKRMPSTPSISYLKMGVDPVGNPTAGDKWARMHEEGAKKKS